MSKVTQKTLYTDSRGIVHDIAEMEFGHLLNVIRLHKQQLEIIEWLDSVRIISPEVRRKEEELRDVMTSLINGLNNRKDL